MFLTGVKGTPLYAEGYLIFNDSGNAIRIPGATHREGFDKTPQSYDIYSTSITYGGQKQMVVTLTTNEERVTSCGCQGVIMLHYIPIEED